ncbi:MAG: hypothetical protein ACTHOB_07190 [Ginsengibacter sp.]
MDEYIKSQAEYLSKVSSIDNPYKTQELRDKISRFLSQFYSPEDRVDFLKYYQLLMDNILAEHRKRCQKEDCGYMTTNKTVTFFINQELNSIKKEQEKERFWRFGTVIENLTINGDGQVLNFGKVEGDIKHNIENLNKSGEKEISKSIEELTNAVTQSIELQEIQKKEYLDTLKLLSEEALKPNDKRLPYTTLKTIIKYSLGTLNAVSSIASISGINLTNIADYFLYKP